MIRSGQDYRTALQDGRAVWIDGERVQDVTLDPRLAPAVDLCAKLHDLHLSKDTAEALTCQQGGETLPVRAVLPFSPQDWWAKRWATDLFLDTAGGVAFRIGDDTAGEIWSLHDARDELHHIDPQFTANIDRLIAQTIAADDLVVTGTTDLKGDLTGSLRVLRETDAGLIVQGTKFETAAAHANRAYVKPALSAAGTPPDEAVAFFCDLNAPGVKILCRPSQLTQTRPLSSRFDEVEALVVFDQVLIPWGQVIFHRQPRAAQVLRASLHRYTAFAFLQRGLRLMDLLIGTCLLRLRRSGLDGLQPVQDSLADLACFRETLNAHLTAAITLGERSPSGLYMPNQALLYAGRQALTAQIARMVQTARELCGGQVGLMPEPRTFAAAGLEVHADLLALNAFAHDLMNSEQASHRLSFFTFAQAPAYAQNAALYRNFDWEGPLNMVRAMAGVTPPAHATPLADSAISRWFSQSRDPQT